MNPKPHIFSIAFALFLTGCAIAADQQSPPQPPAQTQPPLVELDRVGYMAEDPLNEVSGIVREPCTEANWWVLNDSGNDPIVYRIDRQGKIVQPDNQSSQPGFVITGAVNVDWEDITIHNNKLYVVDMGNNGNARKDLGVYIINGLWETKNNQTHWRGQISDVQRFSVAYPEQQTFPAKEFEFDCEAAFILDGKFHILTKHRLGQTMMAKRGTKLYRINQFNPDQTNQLELIDRCDQVGLWVTGADVSPDGNRLAVLGQYELWIYDRPTDGSDQWLTQGNSSRVRLPNDIVKQAEGICWDDNQTLRIVNEQREIYVLPVERVEKALENQQKPIVK